MTDERWRVWATTERGRRYGELMYRRANGELPEMESSKAAARRVAALIQPGDRILDVGCGAGHYLASLRRIVDVPFSYTGVDATPAYVEFGRKAFPDADFEVGDIFDLPFEDQTFDLVMSNNVLLHLPSIQKPFGELSRVARRALLVRTLVGRVSFRIQEVRGSGDEFDADGEPKAFNWFNIYSEAYIRRLAEGWPAVEIEPDTDYDPAQMAADRTHYAAETNVTEVRAGLQTNEYIILPWSFVTLTR